MITDADVTARCDICKDETAWLAVVVQATNGKLLTFDIDTAVVEAGWEAIAPGIHRCHRCQKGEQ